MENRSIEVLRDELGLQKALIISGVFKDYEKTLVLKDLIKESLLGSEFTTENMQDAKTLKEKYDDYKKQRTEKDLYSELEKMAKELKNAGKRRGIRF